jgi:plastocyanin
MRRPTSLTAALAVLVAFALPASAGAGGGNSVSAAGHAFTPDKITISAGDKVVWKEKSGKHTVTFKDGSFDQPLDTSHTKVSRKFSQPGTYRYICQFHVDKGMKGKVVVK